jgi:hypothetical protein
MRRAPPVRRGRSIPVTGPLAILLLGEAAKPLLKLIPRKQGS